MEYFLLILIIGYLFSSKSSPSAEEIAKEIEWQRQHNEMLAKLKHI